MVIDCLTLQRRSRRRTRANFSADSALYSVLQASYRSSAVKEIVACPEEPFRRMIGHITGDTGEDSINTELAQFCRRGRHGSRTGYHIEECGSLSNLYLNHDEDWPIQKQPEPSRVSAGDRTWKASWIPQSKHSNVPFQPTSF